MGPRHLSEHLRFLEEHARDGVTPNLGDAATFWRVAMATYTRLEASEAGAADDATALPLPKSMHAHVAAILDSPVVRQTFDTVPVSFGMVELDRLIVSQYSLTRSIIEDAVSGFIGRPSGRQLARLCLPLDAQPAPCRVLVKDDREFVFAANAHDMRFLGARLIDPSALAGAGMCGHPSAVVALGFGFSSNLLNVVRLNGRHVLNNGHHRAYALRRMGVTHAPCLIQVCESRAELHEAATPEIIDNDDLYFDAPRPPLLRDFDDAALARSVPARRMQRLVRFRFAIESTLAAMDPDLPVSLDRID